jgi:hypothetical protein
VDFCHVARQRGLRYAWVDTCCIDKRSSAELSAATNSMYRWYKESAECYIYLEDYRPDNHSSLRTCEWFKRGWTLQELIAPRTCIFFTASWAVIGHKHYWDDRHCACKRAEGATATTHAWGPDVISEVAAITDIHAGLLKGAYCLNDYSVAQRMSWAAKRATTRLEDRAYSLLGIFDVNMPLLYGEGHKAFRRLQEEIIRTKHDTSIFCFGLSDTLDLDNNAQPIDIFTNSVRVLVSSPAAFAQCQDVRQCQLGTKEPYSITNIGLRMMAFAYVLVRPSSLGSEEHVHAIPLKCRTLSATSSNQWSTFGNLFLLVAQISSEEDEGTRVFRIGLQSSVERPSRFKGAEHEVWEPTQQRVFYFNI